MTEHHLEFLSLTGGCRGSSKSTHVKMPHCWKSHATAHFSSIEAAARHEAERNEQVSRGYLERQKLENESNSEKERCKLLELQSVTAAVESTGQAKAEAQAQAERILIECHSEIEG